MMITNQEIFDAAWQAFIVEQRPASARYNVYTGVLDTCLYRSTDGGRCAIGLSIPDNQYDPNMETADPRELKEHFNIEFEDLDFATKAQERLHDGIWRYLGKPEEAEFVRQCYLKVAEYWHLEVPEAA